MLGDDEHGAHPPLIDGHEYDAGLGSRLRVLSGEGCVDFRLDYYTHFHIWLGYPSSDRPCQMAVDIGREEIFAAELSEVTTQYCLAQGMHDLDAVWIGDLAADIRKRIGESDA